jgi:TolA-binding protein
MGQSYHIKRDYPNALKSFQSLLQGFPASPKVPDALLETGEVYQEQQQSAQARTVFQKVLTSYPASSAATQARTRLAQLK